MMIPQLARGIRCIHDLSKHERYQHFAKRFAAVRVSAKTKEPQA
jgi:hypothetical protein